MKLQSEGVWISSNQEDIIMELQSCWVFVIWIWNLEGNFLFLSNILNPKVLYNGLEFYKWCTKYNWVVEAMKG